MTDYEKEFQNCDAACGKPFEELVQFFSEIGALDGLRTIRVDFREELESKSAPKIKKAAEKIAKQRIDGYEDLLLAVLKILIEKPKSWQA